MENLHEDCQSELMLSVLDRHADRCRNKTGVCVSVQRPVSQLFTHITLLLAAQSRARREKGWLVHERVASQLGGTLPRRPSFL